jgi:hypothetical protein
MSKQRKMLHPRVGGFCRHEMRHFSPEKSSLRFVTRIRWTYTVSTLQGRTRIAKSYLPQGNSIGNAWPKREHVHVPGKGELRLHRVDVYRDACLFRSLLSGVRYHEVPDHRYLVLFVVLSVAPLDL